MIHTILKIMDDIECILRNLDKNVTKQLNFINQIRQECTREYLGLRALY